MNGKLLVGFLGLLCVSCSQAQQQGGHALGNANSVVRSVAPKVWTTNQNANNTNNNAAPQTEDEATKRARMNAQQ